MKPIHILAWIASALFWVGCATVDTPDIPTVDVLDRDDSVYEFSALAPAKPGYVLNTQDEFEVNFLFERQLSTRVKVRPDGAVALPIVDDVLVAGLTPSELDSMLTTAYGTYFKDPELTVNVISFAPDQVYVMGEVRNVQGMKLQPGMTVVQALAAAGGPVPGANMGSVMLLRRVGADKAIARRVDLNAVLGGDGGSWDLLLAPSDVIFVPATFVAEISRFVKDTFGGLMAAPLFYLRGWEMFNTDLVYGRFVQAGAGN